MKYDEVWTLEESLWLRGMDVYREVLHDDCVMAFASPIGVMKGPEIARSLEGTPRWASVSMSGKTVGDPDECTVCLGYKASAMRDDEVHYEAFCTSTYCHQDGRWKLIQHQQTPIQ